MLMTGERRPAIRTLRGRTIHVLQEAGGIRECEEQAWMQECADPHTRERPSVSPVETRSSVSIRSPSSRLLVLPGRQTGSRTGGARGNFDRLC
jgi:hypothetical protein